MIECKKLSFSKGESVLINALSCAIEKQKLTVIVGPNGAGKSTLLKLLLGLEAADSGDVCFRVML